MVFCYECGAEVPAEANFCLECGADLSAIGGPDDSSSEDEAEPTEPIDSDGDGESDRDSDERDDSRAVDDTVSTADHSTVASSTGDSSGEGDAGALGDADDAGDDIVEGSGETEEISDDPEEHGDHTDKASADTELSDRAVDPDAGEPGADSEIKEPGVDSDSDDGSRSVEADARESLSETQGVESEPESGSEPRDRPGTDSEDVTAHEHEHPAGGSDHDEGTAPGGEQFAYDGDAPAADRDPAQADRADQGDSRRWVVDGADDAAARDMADPAERSDTTGDETGDNEPTAEEHSQTPEAASGDPRVSSEPSLEGESTPDRRHGPPEAGASDAQGGREEPRSARSGERSADRPRFERPEQSGQQEGGASRRVDEPAATEGSAGPSTGGDDGNHPAIVGAIVGLGAFGLAYVATYLSFAIDLLVLSDSGASAGDLGPTNGVGIASDAVGELQASVWEFVFWLFYGGLNTDMAVSPDNGGDFPSSVEPMGLVDGMLTTVLYPAVLLVVLALCGLVAARVVARERDAPMDLTDSAIAGAMVAIGFAGAVVASTFVLTFGTGVATLEAELGSAAINALLYGVVAGGIGGGVASYFGADPVAEPDPQSGSATGASPQSRRPRGQPAGTDRRQSTASRQPVDDRNAAGGRRSSREPVGDRTRQPRETQATEQRPSRRTSDDR